MDRAYYHQIYNQINSKHSNIIVISNSDYNDPKTILDLLVNPNTPSCDDFIFESNDSPLGLSKQDIRISFSKLCKYFFSD